MASDKAKRFIILFLTLVATGCALPTLPTVRNEVTIYDDKFLNSLAELDPGELLNYQQQAYQLEDPLGDHALLNLLRLTATKVAWNTLTGRGYDEILDEINALRSGFEYESIGLDRFAGMRGRRPHSMAGYRKVWSKNDDIFTDVILQEQQNAILPTPGVCHRWSKVYRRNPQSDSFPYILFSKLLWALSYGESSVYFVTENEEQLAQWIVDQDLRSVTLEAVFGKSYRLNSGDVYLSLLTAANVFSRFWYLPDRENLTIATQLKLITPGRDQQADNYGAWHHFWGMVLFGYCHGATTSRLVGWIESKGSHMVSVHDEDEEDYINRHAGKVGAELRKLIENWPTDQDEKRAQTSNQASTRSDFRR